MSQIVTEGSAAWLWMQLLEESKQSLSISPPDTLMVYMIHMLVDTADISDEALSIQYATVKQQPVGVQLTALSHMGNEALLLAGLYPEQAFSRAVDPSYFQYMGMRAYSDLHLLYLWRDSEQSQLYHDLAIHFPQLVQLLFYLRCLQKGVPACYQHALIGHCADAYGTVYRALQ